MRRLFLSMTTRQNSITFARLWEEFTTTTQFAGRTNRRSFQQSATAYFRKRASPGYIPTLPSTTKHGCKGR
jgi:hypothetical protein